MSQMNINKVSVVCESDCKNQNCGKCADVIGKVFNGDEGAAAVVYLVKTPGNGALSARIQVNACSAVNVEKIHKALDGISYEADPEHFEKRVAYELVCSAPELVSAVNYAFSNEAVIIEVLGLPGPAVQPCTPDNGLVEEISIAEHVTNLVGVCAGTLGFQGFAYSGENAGKMLRAVAPKLENAGQASSQGFDSDLGMHMDNANRTIPHTFDTAQPERGPMNAYQAFATVKPCPDTPMEVTALQDIVNEVINKYGVAVISALEQPDFAVCKPDSHGGGPDISGVPVLVRDAKARVHGRFHMANITGLTSEAETALGKFRDIVANTKSTIKIPGRKNGIILYSNSQCMHRRSRYSPRFDGSDRYYVRLYLTPFDVMAAFSAHAEGRVFN